MSVGVGLCFAASTLFQACFADNTKTKSDKSTQTPTSFTMINWANLDVVDYLRSGALIVAFCAILLSDQKGKGASRGRRNMWVNAEVVAFFVLGMMCFFFPTSFLEYFVKTPPSVLTLCTVQALGTLMISHVVTIGRLQHSIETNSVVHATWLLSSLIMAVSLLLVVLTAHFNESFFKDQHLTFHALAMILFIAGLVYHLMTGDRIGSSGSYHGSSSDINFYLVLDGLLMFVLALVSIAQPSYMATLMTVKVDSVTMFFNQATGIHLLLDSFMTFGAMFFTDNADKKQIFAGRLAGLAMLVPLVVLTHWKHGIFNSAGVMVACVIYTLRAIILLQGYRSQ